MKKILSNKLFMYMTVADLLSNFGDVVYYMALMNYVLFLPDPSFALSLITLSETLPTFSRLLTGYWSDRIRNKISTIQWTLIIRFGLFLILGYIMSFPPALWIVLVAAVMNFFSDIAGQLENGLYIPVHLRIISKEERSEYMGFSQSVNLASYILFEASGAFLIAVMSFSSLAFLNAVSFLIPLLMITALRKRFDSLFAEKPLEYQEKPDNEKKTIIANMWNTLKLAIREMKNVPDMQSCMAIAPAINGLMSVFPAIVTLVISQNKDFVIGTPALTLAIFQTCAILGSILGGILVMSLLKTLSIRRILKISTGIVAAIAFALLLQNSYLLMFLFLLLGIFGGTINPKLNAAIYNTISEDKIATVSGGIGTYFQIGIVFMKLLVSFLILFFTLRDLSLFLLVAAIALFAFSLLKTERREMSV